MYQFKSKRKFNKTNIWTTCVDKAHADKLIKKGYEVRNISPFATIRNNKKQSQ